MEQTKKKEMISFIAAVLLILLFAYAAVSKLVDHQRFVEQMQLAPVPLMKLAAPVLGWVVPQVEIVIVLMLLFERYRRMGLICSFFLLLAFELYISGMLLSGLDLPCTCGGLISKLQWGQHLVFNGVFMIVAIFPFIYQFIIHKYQSNRYSAQNI